MCASSSLNGKLMDLRHLCVMICAEFIIKREITKYLISFLIRDTVGIRSSSITTISTNMVEDMTTPWYKVKKPN